jgi:hypothetical protein
VDEVKFSRPPALYAGVYGDAREPRGFKFAASLAAAEIILPWGTLTAPRLTVRRAGFGGGSESTLAHGRLQTRLDGGEIDLAATLNLATRDLQFHATSDYDFQRIRPSLPPKTARWLGQFSWEQPPHIIANGQLTLPAWTNRLADWPALCVARLALDGEFRVGRAAFRGVPALAAQSRVSYSNAVWRLPDLLVTRPEVARRVRPRLAPAGARARGTAGAGVGALRHGAGGGCRNLGALAIAGAAWRARPASSQ